MLVEIAIAVSTGRIADPTRTILPYLGRNCDSVKAVIVLICLAIYDSCNIKFFCENFKAKSTFISSLRHL